MAPLHCGFCGKGPFPTQAGLNKHVSQAKSCHRASQDEFGTYVENVWYERIPTPGPSTPDELSTTPSGSLFTDIEDTQGLDDNINIIGTGRDSYSPVGQTGEEVPDDEHNAHHTHIQAPASDVVFVEPFPEDAMAGAIWGKATPKFQVLWEEHLDGASKWSPFKDEEEWVLAEWLIKNVGQKQTNAFLKLPIVCHQCCFRGVGEKY